MPNVSMITVQGATSIGAATVTGPDQSISMQMVPGLTVIVDVTALAGTAPTLTVAIEGKDPISGKYFALTAALTAIAAPGTFIYQIAPGLADAPTTPVGGVSGRQNTIVPPAFRIKVTGGGTAITNASYTVAAAWVG